MSVRIVLVVVCSIALLVFVVRVTWARGKRVVVGAEAVDVHIRRGKNKALHGARVSVESPGALRFSFERENWVDRLAKVIGFAHEWQTGDHPFDGRVYLLCDDPQVLERLSSNGRLRDALLRLLAVARRSLHCKDGRLWIACGAEGEAKEMSDENLQRRYAQKFGADLSLLRGSLLPIAGSGLESSRDRAIRPRAWVARMSAACALAGLIGGIYSLYLDRHQVVHVAIVHWSNGIALAAAFGLCAFLLLRLRGTSVAHRAFMDILLAAVPGAWLAANGVAAWCNEHLDRTTPASYGVRVESVYRTKSKGKYVYHLEVENWPDARGTRKVRIDAAVYAIVQPGGCVDVIWRRGRIGDGWVSGYRQNNNGQCGGAFVE
jgi:hypothetical protein